MAKRKTRISGCELRVAQEYAKKEEDGRYGVSVSEIEKQLEDYLNEAQESGKYSVAGLCISLGITRERLDAWREGYFDIEDVYDELVIRNEKLATCIEMGLLHIQRFWEECDKSAVQSKHVKMLERSGAFEEKKTRSIATPPFDLGLLQKYSK